jgi:hypothetical protein
VHFSNTGGNGSFIMNNSVIRENSLEGFGNEGGGVYFHNTGGTGSFIMNNSVIRENTLSGYGLAGGGVFFGQVSNVVFTMKDSRIEDNRGLSSSAGGGGGVSFFGEGTSSFTMINSIIQNNTGSGGVSIGAYSGSTVFAMTGGSVIRGNEARVDFGGGVHVQNVTFTKDIGSIIYGSDEGENSNTALIGGAAVYVTDGLGLVKKMEGTAGADTALSAVYDSGSYTFTGGWEP